MPDRPADRVTEAAPAPGPASAKGWSNVPAKPREEQSFVPGPASVSPAEPRGEVLAALQDGPKSSVELGCDPGFLRAMEADGLVEIDPNRFPDANYVPGNPFIARLPGDTRRWPGWSRWNI